MSFERAEAAAARYGSIHRRWVGLQRRAALGRSPEVVAPAVAVTPTLSIAAVRVDPAPVSEVTAAAPAAQPPWPTPSGRPPFKTLVGIPLSSVGSLPDRAWSDTPRSASMEPAPASRNQLPSISSDSPRSEAAPVGELARLAATGESAAAADVDSGIPLRGRRNPALAAFVTLGVAGALLAALVLKGTSGSDEAEPASNLTNETRATPARSPESGNESGPKPAAQIAAPQQPSRTAPASEAAASRDGTTSSGAIAGAPTAGKNANGAEKTARTASVEAGASSAAAGAPKPASSKDTTSKDAVRTKVKTPRQKPPRKTVRGGIIRQNPF